MHTDLSPHPARLRCAPAGDPPPPGEGGTEFAARSVSYLHHSSTAPFRTRRELPQSVVVARYSSKKIRDAIRYWTAAAIESDQFASLACTRFRRHRVRCFDGAGGGSWRDGSLRESSSLRLCA